MKELLNRIANFDYLFFDFDGTLLNSEVIHKQAHSFVLSKILGKEIQLTNREFEKYVGKTDNVIFEEYKTDFHVDFDKESMIKLKKQKSQELLLNENLKIFNYFFDIIQTYPQKKYYILSNQDEQLLITILKAKNIFNIFERIFSLATLNLTKKEFLNNLYFYTHATYKKSILFEDVDVNLKLAKDLGLLSVGVENTFNKNKLHNYDYLIKTY